PGQILKSFPMLIVGGFDIIMVSLVNPQTFPLVTQYVPGVETVIVSVVSPVDHAIPIGFIFSKALSVVLSPLHISRSLPSVKFVGEVYSSAPISGVTVFLN